MTAGAFIEPLVVVVLLFGGAWVNRNTTYSVASPYQDPEQPHDREARPSSSQSRLRDETSTNHASSEVRSSSPSLLPSQENRWRHRTIGILGYQKSIETPNTAVFRNRALSRLLNHFPFLVEVWYWALIYWVYQLGRAFSAVTLVEGTVHVARKHALQVIEAEKRLHMFWEAPIQQYFLQYPQLMGCINWIYSFIHIPGTILFLVCLYYYTVTRNRRAQNALSAGSPVGPDLYEARRRTMAMCNLLAFVVFTLWPCMPPRLLSDPDAPPPLGDVARKYGFVDTVHSKEGSSSVWTQNKFCNQYAMPSLHFGYSLLIGLTIATLPLHSNSQSPTAQSPTRSQFGRGLRPRVPSWSRLLCIVIGFSYPLIILVAIVSTANHFILDAVAGSLVCGIAWNINGVMLNLLPLEDYFLWCVRIHKPANRVDDYHRLSHRAGSENNKAIYQS